MNTGGEVERKLGSLQGWVTAGLCFIVVFAITVMGVMVWQSYRVGENARDLRAVATETHGALCALRLDLQGRYDNGAKILKEHREDPVLIFGLTIPRDQLVQSHDAQASTLRSLRGLDCS